MERLMALQQIIKHDWQKNSFIYDSINSKGICQAFVIFFYYYYFGKAANAPWWSLKKGANAPALDNMKVAFSNK